MRLSFFNHKNKNNMAASKTPVEKPMNIYQKLLFIQKTISGLGKDKKSFGYSYVSGSKVLEHLKPLMNDMGLLLKQEVISIDNTRQDYSAKSGQKSEILTKVQMRFTWVDVDTGQTDENLFAANGQNDWEKGLGSALTYGERYFLLKYFHISTDEDDIDNPERKPEAISKPESKSASQSKPKAKLGDMTKVKEMLLKDRENTISILEQKYELTKEQREELGI